MRFVLFENTVQELFYPSMHRTIQNVTVHAVQIVRVQVLKKNAIWMGCTVFNCEAQPRVAQKLVLYWVYVDYPMVLYRPDVLK